MYKYIYIYICVCMQARCTIDGSYLDKLHHFASALRINTGTHFTGFTITKVQILTPDANIDACASTQTTSARVRCTSRQL